MRLIAIVFLAVSLAMHSASAAEPHPFIRGSWAELLSRQAGKPLVVHFWGLTCGPCLVELPHWAELQRARPHMNIILVAADPSPMPVSDLAAALRKAGLADAESWAFADKFTERLRFEIDPKWRGDMPRTMLLARDGSPTVMPGLADLRAVRDWFDAESAKGK